MTNAAVVIVTGPPAAGKTTLGRALATRLNMPFLYKDGIKETLFDTLGWGDRGWSCKLGVATYALLFHLLEMELAAGRSLVVESNFDAQRDGPRFLALRDHYGFRPLQVCCVADGNVLLERFRSRATTNERHPGHVEVANILEFEPVLLRGRIDPLPLDGPIIEIDTTDLAQIDTEAIARDIQVGFGIPPESRSDAS
jgi:predicted kinase